MKRSQFLLLLAAFFAISFHFVDDPMRQSVLGIGVPIFIAAAYIVEAIEGKR